MWHNLPSGGAKRALHKDVRGFLDHGHHVEVWSPPTADRAFAPLSGMAEEHEVDLQFHQREAKPVTMGEFLADQRQDIADMDQHCRVCAAQIAEIGFDLLYANACMFYRVTSIGRHVDLPSVLYLPEPFRPLYEASPSPPWMAIDRGHKWWLHPWRMRQAVNDLRRTSAMRIQVREEVQNARAYDRILVNSMYSRETVLRAYGLDSRVCYPGVDTGVWKPTGMKREPFLLGVGALVPEKNIPFVIRAVAASRHRGYPLIWIGNVSVPEVVIEAREVAEAEGIDFRPLVAVSDAELIDHLNRATVLLHAPRLEPMGLAPLEAGACKLPVLAVPEAGVRETVRHRVTGLLVDAEPQAMAAGLDELVSDPSLRERLGAGGYEWVTSEWTLEAAADRLQGHLDEVMRSRP